MLVSWPVADRGRRAMGPTALGRLLLLPHNSARGDAGGLGGIISVLAQCRASSRSPRHLGSSKFPVEWVWGPFTTKSQTTHWVSGGRNPARLASSFRRTEEAQPGNWSRGLTPTAALLHQAPLRPAESSLNAVESTAIDTPPTMLVARHQPEFHLPSSAPSTPCLRAFTISRHIPSATQRR
ncbi:uncharacterized protein J3D65DRAFT_620339 [Phyllosticta citribraziliensis]|uniref:Uncharacterized protein n=1 Tax=Phyllosticta citribraziliensis TaxID=989973 RepID=A0ABR1LXN6_9PEZI